MSNTNINIQEQIKTVINSTKNSLNSVQNTMSNLKIASNGANLNLSQADLLNTDETGYKNIRIQNAQTVGLVSANNQSLNEITSNKSRTQIQSKENLLQSARQLLLPNQPIGINPNINSTNGIISGVQTSSIISDSNNIIDIIKQPKVPRGFQSIMSSLVGDLLAVEENVTKIKADSLKTFYIDNLRSNLLFDTSSIKKPFRQSIIDNGIGRATTYLQSENVVSVGQSFTVPINCGLNSISVNIASARILSNDSMFYLYQGNGFNGTQIVSSLIKIGSFSSPKNVRIVLSDFSINLTAGTTYTFRIISTSTSPTNPEAGQMKVNYTLSGPIGSISSFGLPNSNNALLFTIDSICSYDVSAYNTFPITTNDLVDTNKITPKVIEFTQSFKATKSGILTLVSFVQGYGRTKSDPRYPNTFDLKILDGNKDSTNVLFTDSYNLWKVSNDRNVDIAINTNVAIISGNTYTFKLNFRSSTDRNVYVVIDKSSPYTDGAFDAGLMNYTTTNSAFSIVTIVPY